MTIWQIKTTLEYHYLALVNEDDASKLNFIGESLSHSWQPLPVEVVHEGTGMGDFPKWTGGDFVCSERGKNILSPLIGNHVEFLPLKGNEEMFYFVNVTHLIDCLDHSHSQIDRFTSGNIRAITHYVFKHSCINDAPIFKIPERRSGPILVSDEFKALVEGNQLSGLVFRKLEP